MLNISLYPGIRTVVVDGEPKTGNIGETCGQKFVRDLYQNGAVSGRAAGRMHQSGVDQQQLSRAQGDRLIKQCDDSGAFQDINNLNGFMPVAWRKASMIVSFLV